MSFKRTVEHEKIVAPIKSITSMAYYTGSDDVGRVAGQIEEAIMDNYLLYPEAHGSKAVKITITFEKV